MLPQLLGGDDPLIVRALAVCAVATRLLIKLGERVGPLLIAHDHGRLVADLWCPYILLAIVELGRQVHVDCLGARRLVELDDRVGGLLVRKRLYLLVALSGMQLASWRVVDHLCIAFATIFL